MDGTLKYSGPGNDQSKIIQNITLLTGSGSITGNFDCEVPAAIVYIPCTPQPTPAYAGPNQLNVFADSTMLEGNHPLSGTGIWSISNGAGGIITNPGDSNSYFKGVIGTTYTLIWSISTTCGISASSVNIRFVPCSPQPIQADAGPDQIYIQGNTTTMQANYPNPGTGQWTFIGGNGGVLSDSSKYNALFFGLSDSTYVLKWTITTICGSTSDSMIASMV